MDGEAHTIGNAIRPLFADLVAFWFELDANQYLFFNIIHVQLNHMWI